MTEGLFDPPEHASASAAHDSVAPDAPLAERMRPRTLEEYVGQEHLVGEGRVLERALQGSLAQSLILWGPPGSGKTTLARLIAAKSGMHFVPYSAVMSGIKEIRAVMTAAEGDRRRTHKKTLLFVDEIHRFNKAQQDAFLPYVERGDIVLIGATTENPSFEINSALLSRMSTVILQVLRPEEVVRILRRAIDEERGLARRVRASDAVLDRIAHASDGDARRALTLLESAANLLPDGGTIDDAIVREALQRKVLHYDKSGEEHYNLVSALHKSIRNSDENASLYWLARMMQAGEDGEYLARRLIRMASEDVGLAHPMALNVALDCAAAFSRVGYPEGKIFLAQAAVYLARAPKSNALYVALGRAEEDVETTSADPVPLHLRNAPTKLMKEAGYGAGYRYAHDDPKAVDEMTCMPPSLAGKRYFEKRDKRPDATG
jgi:putative ATPase